jgi:hypothetical protein
MPRATTLLASTSLVAGVATIWLYVDNRSLRSDLAALRDAQAPKTEVAQRAPEPMLEAARSTAPSRATWVPPVLPTAHDESKMDRRARRQQEMSAMLGRGDGETEDEYRARMLPMLKAALAIPRGRVEEMRKIAEEKAKVSDIQSKQLDQAFQKVYGDVIDYTNKAIADGTLSPYERNIANWLEYGGGLGTMLQDANGQVGKILSSDQIKIMYDSGFEWGEYLGLEAPWEKLNPPPPPKK